MKGLRYIHPLRGRRLVTVCHSEHGPGDCILFLTPMGRGGRAISQIRYRGNNHEELETLALRLQQQSSVGDAPGEGYIVEAISSSPARCGDTTHLPNGLPGLFWMESPQAADLPHAGQQFWLWRWRVEGFAAVDIRPPG